jgi:hypothetical protein
MTCEECEQILLDSSHCVTSKGWMPGVSVLNYAQSHAQNCLACAARVSEIARLKEALDQLRISTMHMEAPAIVETNLLTTFRRDITARRQTVAKAFPWKLLLGSAATLLLVASGVMLYSALKPRSAVTAKAARRDVKSLDQSPRVSSATAADRTIVKGPRSRADHATNKKFTSSSATLGKPMQEPMRRPTVLPVRDELSLNGGGNVIRVTLPFSSLIVMGVPVRPDVSDRRVTADVMMDPFGAVVAIHLVEAKSIVE